jgi:hypothetical protein
MARLRCNTCQGEYTDVGPDGLRYFHACAPSTLVRVTRAGVDQDVALAAVQPTDLVFVLRGGVRTQVAFSAILATDVRADDRTTPRANFRDENTALVGGQREGTRQIKARGAGATVIG